MLRCLSIALALIVLPSKAESQEAASPLQDIQAPARELANQLDYLQQAIIAIPGPPEGRGLFDQLTKVQLDLIYFRQQVKGDASREMILIAFNKVDIKLHNLLGDLSGFEKWNPALRMVASRVMAADHDLHFALTGSEKGLKANRDAVYRQTLVLNTRATNLSQAVDYYFEGLDDQLAEIKPAVRAFISAVDTFQSSLKDNKSIEPAKTTFEQVERNWDKVVARIRAQPQQQAILLQANSARIDQVLARVAGLLGVEDRRAPLANPLD